MTEPNSISLDGPTREAAARDFNVALAQINAMAQNKMTPDQAAQAFGLANASSVIARNARGKLTANQVLRQMIADKLDGVALPAAAGSNIATASVGSPMLLIGLAAVAAFFFLRKGRGKMKGFSL